MKELLTLKKVELLIGFRFAIVGLSGIMVDLFVTWYFKEIKLTSYLLANALGFCFACTSNYILNRIYTFDNRDSRILRQFSMFILFSLVGLLINSMIVYILGERFKMNFYLSKVCAIGLVFCWNLTISRLVTFQNLSNTLNQKV